MKNVLILTTISGFLSQFEMNDVRILKSMGYRLHYATNFHNPVYETDRDTLCEMGIRLYQIDIEKSPLHIMKNFHALIQLSHIIKTQEIDLIHCHNPIGGVLGRLAAFLSRKQKTKVIYTAHGFHFYHGAPLRNWLFYYPVEALLSKITDCLITINKEDYKRAQNHLFHCRGMVARIPGVGVKTERFAPADGKRDEMRKKLGISPETFYILSVGELNKNKNHEVILRAIAELKNPQIHYGICGEGNREGHLQRLAKDLGITGQFHLFGFRKDIPDMLQCADCFAFPSKREGLGIAAIEAMAGGIPLITSDCRGTREYMTDGETGYVCSHNSINEYGQAIRYLMKNPDIRQKMSEACKKRAAEFDLRETDKIMRNVYQRMSRA